MDIKKDRAKRQKNNEGVSSPHAHFVGVDEGNIILKYCPKKRSYLKNFWW